jgi:hypothetical protein
MSSTRSRISWWPGKALRLPDQPFRLLGFAAVVVAAVALSGCRNPASGGSSAPVESQAAAPDAAQNLPVTGAATSHSIAVGTIVPIDNNDVIDTGVVEPGVLYTGKVDRDVVGSDGGIAIPARTNAVMIVRDVNVGGVPQLVLGLYTIGVGGLQHRLANGKPDVATLTYLSDSRKGQIHLQSHSLLNFRLDRAVDLR